MYCHVLQSPVSLSVSACFNKLMPLFETIFRRCKVVSKFKSCEEVHDPLDSRTHGYIHACSALHCTPEKTRERFGIEGRDSGTSRGGDATCPQGQGENSEGSRSIHRRPHSHMNRIRERNRPRTYVSLCARPGRGMQLAYIPAYVH